MGGRVVDGNGIGVDGVKIVVDGQERSMTDREGYYKLDQVKLFLCSWLLSIFYICLLIFLLSLIFV